MNIDIIKDLMYNEYNKIKNLNDRNTIENDFYIKFYSWDKGDCSDVGLLIILLWYISSKNNKQYYENYNEIISFCNNINV